MNEHDEVTEQLRILQRGVPDYHERVDLEESICMRLADCPENHTLVKTYHEITGTRTDSSFDPEYLQ